MTKNSLITIFFIITIGALLALLILFLKKENFETSELSLSIQKRLLIKEKEILQKINIHYKMALKVPVIITHKLPDNNFGMATYNSQNKAIKIYLNKKRFFESEEYMIMDVLPHEYAHALMFALGKFSQHNSGHTKAWQRACQNLGGVKCDRFVNHHDIVIDKTNFFK